MNSTASLCELSAVELRRGIAARDISPVELLAACHARLDAVNPALNAVVAEDRDAALAAAPAAAQAVLRGAALGPLHGLPVGPHDLPHPARRPTPSCPPPLPPP